ncbi:hypothetical protein ABZ688_20350, partial [Streptomyces fimicarius]
MSGSRAAAQAGARSRTTAVRLLTGRRTQRHDAVRGRTTHPTAPSETGNPTMRTLRTALLTAAAAGLAVTALAQVPAA